MVWLRMKGIWKQSLILASLLVLILNFSGSVFAQTPAVMANDQPQPAEIKYFLAYPGILPDHPLYPLKMLRDRIVEFLISDPIKKAEFYLLQADKRLGAAQMLFDKDKTELGFETLNLASGFFEKAINQTQTARQQNKDTQSLVSSLSLANLKHKQVLEKMPPGVEKALSQNQALRLKINQLMGEKFE